MIFFCRHDLYNCTRSYPHPWLGPRSARVSSHCDRGRLLCGTYPRLVKRHIASNYFCHAYGCPEVWSSLVASMSQLSTRGVLIISFVCAQQDYTVHLADSFMGSKSITREEKVTDALIHTGSSVLSGAISTLSASIPMFGAQIIFFVKFGAFVFMTIGLSLIFSLGFFCAVLTIVGPLGKFGNISNFYAGIVEHMHKNLLELEEEQAKINASRRLKKLDGIPEEDKNEEEGFHKNGDNDADQ